MDCNNRHHKDDNSFLGLGHRLTSVDVGLSVVMLPLRWDLEVALDQLLQGGQSVQFEVQQLRATKQAASPKSPQPDSHDASDRYLRSRFTFCLLQLQNMFADAGSGNVCTRFRHVILVFLCSFLIASSFLSK